MNLPVIASQNASVAELYRSNADRLTSWERYNGSKDDDPLVTSAQHSNGISKIKTAILSSTRAISFVRDGADSGNAKVRLLDISGTEPSQIGSELLVTSSGTFGGPIAALDSRFAAVLYNGTASNNARVIDTNSDVLSLVGSEQTIAAPAIDNSGVDSDWEALNSTQLIVASHGNNFLRATVLDVDTGTGAITANTPTTLDSGTNVPLSGVNITVFDTGKFFVTSSQLLIGRQYFGSVSGTTVTAQGQMQIAIPTNSGPSLVAPFSTQDGWVNNAQDIVWMSTQLNSAFDFSLGAVATLLTPGFTVNDVGGSVVGGSASRIIKMDELNRIVYFLVLARPSDISPLVPANIQNQLTLRGARFDLSTRQFTLSPRVNATIGRFQSGVYTSEGYSMAKISNTKAIISYRDSLSSGVAFYIANL